MVHLHGSVIVSMIVNMILFWTKVQTSKMKALLPCSMWRPITCYHHVQHVNFSDIRCIRLLQDASEQGLHSDLGLLSST